MGINFLVFSGNVGHDFLCGLFYGFYICQKTQQKQLWKNE